MNDSLTQRREIPNDRHQKASISVVHVIAGLDAAHGGPSYSVPRLCASLAVRDVGTTLVSVSASDAGSSDDLINGYRDRRFKGEFARTPFLKALRKSSGLSLALRQLTPKMDVVHNHGLWLLPNIMASRQALRARKPIIISPRGMLSPTALAFSRWKKCAVWYLAQGHALRQATCIHATSEAEYQEVRALGLAGPVAIIPNGVDLPELAPSAKGQGQRVLLSLGRIHPKKGLNILLNAWARVEGEYFDWQLRIVGPAEGGYDEELRILANSLGLNRVSIEGAVYGAAKHTLYRTADLFVLSTLNENFGQTVAESLAAGTPVISTRAAPWGGLETEGCGWWTNGGVEPLAAALHDALALPREELKLMGARGRAWMARDFSWDNVAVKMIETYRWLCGQGPLTSTIRLD